jgi:tetratricopeptide (TPR) repeat protein
MKTTIVSFLICLTAYLQAQTPFGRVRTLLPEDDFKTSMQILDSCADKGYFKDSVLYYKCLVNLKKQNSKTAQKNCEELEQTYPQFTEVHYLKGLIYYLDNNYGKSVEEFNIVLKERPSHIKALYNRSLVLGLLEDYPKAIEDLNSCISLNPSYGMAHYSRAYWYEFTGKYDDAIKDYEESIKLDPKNYDAYYGLAYIYQNRKENDKACKVVNQAVTAGSQIAEELREIFCR